jgi:hypothetical protein
MIQQVTKRCLSLYQLRYVSSRLISRTLSRRQEVMSLRNVLGLAFFALVLAFVAVQGASLVQSPPAPAPLLKGESVAETAVRNPAAYSTSLSTRESLPTAVLGPLVIASLCYLFMRRRV